MKFITLIFGFCFSFLVTFPELHALAPVSYIQEFYNDEYLEQYVKNHTLSSFAPDDYYYTALDRSKGRTDPFYAIQNSFSKIMDCLKNGVIRPQSIQGISAVGVWMQEGYILNEEDDYSIRIFKRALTDESDFIPTAETLGINCFGKYGPVQLTPSDNFQIIAKDRSALKKLINACQKDNMSVWKSTEDYAIIISGQNFFTVLTQKRFDQFTYCQVIKKAKDVKTAYLKNRFPDAHDEMEYTIWQKRKADLRMKRFNDIDWESLKNTIALYHTRA